MRKNEEMPVAFSKGWRALLLLIGRVCDDLEREALPASIVTELVSRVIGSLRPHIVIRDLVRTGYLAGRPSGLLKLTNRPLPALSKCTGEDPYMLEPEEYRTLISLWRASKGHDRSAMAALEAEILEAQEEIAVVKRELAARHLELSVFLRAQRVLCA
jgi:hypothetical protein